MEDRTLETIIARWVDPRVCHHPEDVKDINYLFELLEKQTSEIKRLKGES